MNLSRLRHLVAPLAALLMSLMALVAVATPSHARSTQTAATGAPGAGWYLTVVYRGRPAEYGGLAARSEKLVLVSPTGETRTVLRMAVRHQRTASLADWSPDGATALLAIPGGHGTQVIRVDVATGSTQTMKVRDASAIMLDPSGAGIVYSAYRPADDGRLSLQRMDWAGQVTVLPTVVTGAIMPGRGETAVVGGEQPGQRVLRVVSLTDGAVQSTIQTGASCTPVRWWDQSRILATCGRNLSLIDMTTGDRADLTHQHGRGDYGHLDGRLLPSGLYLQIAGACGTTFIAREAKDGSIHQVHVPGAVGNVVMVGTAGRDLVIQHAATCEGGRPVAELSRFNPVNQHEHVLVRLGHQEDFGAILGYGEIRAVFA